MKIINYPLYAFEAIKITLFCLLVTGIFTLFGSSNDTLLIVFNMAVMSAAATFSVEQKRLNHVALGGFVIIISIISGGIIGFYYPWSAKLLTILYAGLAFYLPQKKYQTNIFVTSSVMFLIFSSLPFNVYDGMKYLLNGLVEFSVFIIFYLLFNKTSHTHTDNIISRNQIQNNHIAAMIAVLSLTIGYAVNYYLSINHYFSHLYWIELTALMVIQGSQQKTIQTAIKRMLINAMGAIFIVILFNYVIPLDFWINFLMLVLFLFLIFFFSFSYIGRVLFIELFVLGFTHLLGDYKNTIALDRVILTSIGGSIVIISTPISYILIKLVSKRPSR